MVRRTYDIELILALLFHDDIWPTASEDTSEQGDNVPDPIKNIYLSLHAGGKVIGFVYAHSKYYKLIQCHINILPEYRREWSKAAGAAIIEWILCNTEHDQIYTEVPAIYSNVRRYLESFGFECIGTIKACYTKNQHLNDVNILTKRIR